MSPIRSGLVRLALLLSAGALLAAPATAPGRLEPPRAGGKWMAIVVGVSSYRHIAPIPFAKDDAAVFRQYLLDAGIPDSLILYFPDSLAKAPAIDGALQRVIEWANPGDSVIFYFAGHGDMEDSRYSTLPPAVLLGIDAQGNNERKGNSYLAGGALYLYVLEARLAALTRSGVTVVAITDACHDGHLASDRASAPFVLRALAVTTPNMLMSTEPGGLSREDERWGGGHGVFTWYLIQGLRSGRTKMHDLYNFVYDSVRGNTNSLQTPMYPGSPNLVLPRVLRPGPGGGGNAVRTVRRPPPLWTRLMAAPDTLLTREIRTFRSALAQRRLLEPRSGSAWETLSRLRDMPAAKGVLADLRIDLLVALQSSAWDVIAEYLRGAQRLPTAERFRLAGRELRLAQELLRPNDPIAPQLRTRALFLGAYAGIREGNRSLYRSAEDSLTAALAAEPRASFVLNALGVVYLRTSRAQQAEAQFRRAVELSPQWILPRQNLGTALFSQGRESEAIQKFHDALAVDSLDADTYGSLGSLYLTLGRYLQAEAYLRKAIVIDRRNSFAYRRLGDLYSTKRQFVRAEAMLDTAVRVARDSGGRYDHEAVLDRASFYGSAREPGSVADYAKAREVLQPALTQAPYEPAPLVRLGDLLLNLGKRDSAELAYRRALALDPSYPTSYVGLALVLEGRGQWEQAEVVLQQAQSQVRYLPYAFYNLAGHYIRHAGSSSGAAAAALEARAERAYLAALSADSSYAGAYYGLASLRDRHGDFAGSLRWRLRALAGSDSSAEAPYSLGEFYVKWGQADSAAREQHYTRARELFDRALAIDSTYTSALDARGSLAMRQGRFAEALSDLKRAATLGFAANTTTTYAMSMVNTATTFYTARRLPEAAAGYRAALELDPSNRSAQRWLPRLRYLMADANGALAGLDGFLPGASESERRDLEPLRAMALLDLGRPAEAESQIRRFTDPSDPAPNPRNYLILALARLGQGDEAGALSAYRHATELAPSLRSESALAEFSARARAEIARLAAKAGPS